MALASADRLIPTLSHATERDIDLLLVEELYASPGFVTWIADKAGLPPVATSAVLHSKRRTRSRREIDIFVDITLKSGERAALLIENKLDAAEQPDQAESYRAELATLAGSHPHCAMLVVCPASYRGAHPGFTEKFDRVVTYEDLHGYFTERAGMAEADAARMRFRADLMHQAIEKQRRGYTPVPNGQIGAFNAEYVVLLARIAPQIIPGPTMLKAANPDESVSMIFDHRQSLAALEEDVRPTRFAHELGRGQESRANYVAVTFGGWGAALSELRDRLESDARDLGATFHARPPTKVRPRPGLVMACATAPIDNLGDFEGQRDRIEAGIQHAARLREWLIDNRTLLREWRQMVQAIAGNR